MDEKSRNAPHCENCKWTHKNPLRDAHGNVQIGQDVYTCHRFPPTAVLLQTGPGVATLAAMFAPVTKEMVCSLHEFATEFDVPAALRFDKPN